MSTRTDSLNRDKTTETVKNTSFSQHRKKRSIPAFNKPHQIKGQAGSVQSQYQGRALPKTEVLEQHQCSQELQIKANSILNVEVNNVETPAEKGETKQPEPRMSPNCVLNACVCMIETFTERVFIRSRVWVCLCEDLSFSIIYVMNHKICKV